MSVSYLTLPGTGKSPGTTAGRLPGIVLPLLLPVWDNPDAA